MESLEKQQVKYRNDTFNTKAYIFQIHKAMYNLIWIKCICNSFYFCSFMQIYSHN